MTEPIQEPTDEEVDLIISDGSREVLTILQCISAAWPSGEPIFDEIDRGKMTKQLLKHIRRL